MKRLASMFVLASAGVALGGCASMTAMGWTKLIDGTKGMDNFNRRRSRPIGAAVDGAIQATKGGTDAVATSSARIRTRTSPSRSSSGPATTPTAASSCAARTRRRSPTRTATRPTSSTSGPIRPTAPARSSRWPRCPPDAQGRRQVEHLRDHRRSGKRLVLVLNGVKTVDVQDSKLASGPIALQWGSGTIKFRMVEITVVGGDGCDDAEAAVACAGRSPYEVDGLAGPIGHCHCSTCRKAHAAAFATTARAERAGFQLVVGPTMARPV